MIDYHVHTARCGHAEGSMEECVRRALELGLSEIGFADHLPLLTAYDPTLTMSEDELDGYIEEIGRLKKTYPHIAIKTGIEADFLPGLERETARLLDMYDFDYVIGSIHFIDGWGFDDSRYIEGYKHRELYDIYEHYFGLVARAARSGLFDIIGHLDLVKKFGFRPDKDVTPIIKETIAAIRDAGACVEINTAGLRKPVGEIYPATDILTLCFEAGVPVTLGSDAHRPDEVGMDFAVAVAAAKEAGYKNIAVFTGRERRAVALG